MDFLLIIILVFFGIITPLLFIFYGIFSLIVDLAGAPLVPTSKELVDEILAGANLKKGQTFLELGSGDGRVIRAAVKKYQLNGIGVDLHLPAILYSKIIAKLQGVKTIKFKMQNLFNTNLKNIDVLFIFLLPITLKKLQPKLLKECSKNTLIISHGFKIPEFEKYLIKTQKRALFPTYFYKI